MRILLLALTLSACASDPPTEPQTLVPGDVLSLSWTYGSNAECEGCAERARVECGEEISHPCPFVLFATTLTVTDDSIEFGDATGGADANGLSAEQHAPWIDPLVRQGDFEILLEQRGDDAGLRHLARLKSVTPTTYEANVEWSLFNVAGYTTFHLTAELK